MTYEFRVGGKVVCVDATGLTPHTIEVVPSLHGIYTVREIVDHPKGLGLRFIEIVNPPLPYRGGIAECVFDSQNFRPLEEKSDPVEQFREIARGVTDGTPIIADPEYTAPHEAVRAIFDLYQQIARSTP
jgi:hypothetical protein